MFAAKEAAGRGRGGEGRSTANRGLLVFLKIIIYEAED